MMETKTRQTKPEKMSDEVESLAGRSIRLDVWTSYLAGADALSKTPRQHVNMSQCEEQKWWVSRSRSHAGMSNTRGVRYMEQVRVGRPLIGTGRRAAQRDSAGRQSRALSPALRKTASTELQIKHLLSFLVFRSVATRDG